MCARVSNSDRLEWFITVLSLIRAEGSAQTVLVARGGPAAAGRRVVRGSASRENSLKYEAMPLLGYVHCTLAVVPMSCAAAAV